MIERTKFDAFLPRSASPIVFVLVVACYDYALTALFAAIVRLFHFPPRPLSFWETHGDPTAHIVEGLVFTPLIETCILVGIIELLRLLSYRGDDAATLARNGTSARRNGLLLWFVVDDFEATWKRLKRWAA